MSGGFQEMTYDSNGVTFEGFTRNMSLPRCVSILFSGMESLIDDSSKDREVIVRYHKYTSKEDCFKLTIGQKADGMSLETMKGSVIEIGASTKFDEDLGIGIVAPYKICGPRGNYIIHSNPEKGEEFSGMMTQAGFKIVEEDSFKPEISFNNGMFFEILVEDESINTGSLHSEIVDKADSISLDVDYTVSDDENGEIIQRTI